MQIGTDINTYVPQKIIKKNQVKKDLIDISWDAESVTKAKQSIEDGFMPTRDMPFYMGDPQKKDSGVSYDYTPEEETEWLKCAQDVVHFAQTYGYAMTDDGIMKIDLYPYQVNILRNFQDNRFNILLCGRQQGKTISSALFLAWYLCFQFDKNVIIVANQGETAQEILDKVKSVIFNLPFFLQPGLRSENVKAINFDNGCKVRVKATSKTSGIGTTCHLLYADEFAHVPENLSGQFYKSIFPTLSASKISRMIVTSTPNGFNKFWELWQGAEQGRNSFYPYHVQWWETPGRDEKWKLQMIEDIGGEDIFDQEYACKFVVQSNLLLPQAILQLLEKIKSIYVHTGFEELDSLGIDYSGLKFVPSFNPVELYNPDNRYVITVDLADGVGRDYSVAHIFKVDMLSNLQIKNKKVYSNEYDFFCVKQIGIFRSNTTSVDELSKILEIISFDIIGENHVHIAYEHNFKGDYIFNRFNINPKFFEDMFLHTKHSIDSYSLKPGVSLKHGNRTEFIQRLKRHMQDKRIQVNEFNTVNEFARFSKLNNSTRYEGLGGNDDCVMASLLTIPYMESEYFQTFVDDIIHQYDEQRINTMQRKLYGNEVAIKERKNVETAYSIISNYV